MNRNGHRTLYILSIYCIVYGVWRFFCDNLTSTLNAFSNNHKTDCINEKINVSICLTKLLLFNWWTWDNLVANVRLYDESNCPYLHMFICVYLIGWLCSIFHSILCAIFLLFHFSRILLFTFSYFSFRIYFFSFVSLVKICETCMNNDGDDTMNNNVACRIVDCLTIWLTFTRHIGMKILWRITTTTSFI